MKACFELLETLNLGVYMLYELEDGDPHKRNWLHEGLSHQVSLVFQSKFSDVLRPFRTMCGIQVAERIEPAAVGLYNLVNIETTCLWCVSGKVREFE